MPDLHVAAAVRALARRLVRPVLAYSGARSAGVARSHGVAARSRRGVAEPGHTPDVHSGQIRLRVLLDRGYWCAAASSQLQTDDPALGAIQGEGDSAPS